MDLLRCCVCLGIIIMACCARAEYVVRVDQFSFQPADCEVVRSHSANIEQEGNRSYLSGHLELARTVSEVIMHASMDMSRPRMPRVRLFDTKLDLCAFFNNAYRSKFLRQFHNSYLSFINVRPTCPLQAHLNYSLHRGYLDEHLLPELLPECSYFLKLEFRNKTKSLAIVQFSGHIFPVATKAAPPKFTIKF